MMIPLVDSLKLPVKVALISVLPLSESKFVGLSLLNRSIAANYGDMVAASMES